DHPAPCQSKHCRSFRRRGRDATENSYRSEHSLRMHRDKTANIQSGFSSEPDIKFNSVSAKKIAVLRLKRQLNAVLTDSAPIHRRLTHRSNLGLNHAILRVLEFGIGFQYFDSSFAGSLQQVAITSKVRDKQVQHTTLLCTHEVTRTTELQVSFSNLESVIRPNHGLNSCL